jgi:hypothetical protein
MHAQQANALARTNVLDFTVDAGGIDFIGDLAQQSQQDCSICAMSVTGESEGTIQLDADPGDLVQSAFIVKRSREFPGRPHRSDRVRTGGANADLEDFKNACVHQLTLRFQTATSEKLASKVHHEPIRWGSLN